MAGIFVTFVIMHKRLSSLIKALGLSAAQFADEIGVQRSSISHVISGRNKPSMDFIEKILQRFPRVNADWLIMGSGSVFRDEDLFSGQEKLIPATEKREKSEAGIKKPEVMDEPKVDRPEKSNKLLASGDTPAQGETRAVGKQLKEVILVYTDHTFRVLKPENPMQ
jgi:transcriptional regulator with XRE-family HTH domain